MVADEVQSAQATTQHGGLEAVGAQLASAREQQQLKLDAVASELHLRPEVVRALEKADAAQLPSQPFVRGYVKSYARLLGLDEGALLAQLPRATAHSPAPLGRVGMRRRTGLSVPLGRLLASGLVLVCVIVVGVYTVPAVQRLWSARTAEPPADELLIPLPDAAETAERPDMPLPEQREIQPEPAVEPAAAAPLAVEASDGADAAAPAAGEQPQAGEPQQTAEQSAGPAVVQLRFIEDSWVEMEANGRKLVVGTQLAGSERTVRVEPPVYLLLGNAPGVEVSFRGRPVDVTPHQRGKVARLTLED